MPPGPVIAAFLSSLSECSSWKLTLAQREISPCVFFAHACGKKNNTCLCGFYHRCFFHTYGQKNTPVTWWWTPHKWFLCCVWILPKRCREKKYTESYTFPALARYHFLWFALWSVLVLTVTSIGNLVFTCIGEGVEQNPSTYVVIVVSSIYIGHYVVRHSGFKWANRLLWAIR